MKNGKVSDGYPKFNPFIYSVEAYVPLLNLHMGECWIPNANRDADHRIGNFTLPKSGSLLRYYLWLHIIIGWLLTTLLVAAITGLLKA